MDTGAGGVKAGLNAYRCYQSDLCQKPKICTLVQSMGIQPRCPQCLSGQSGTEGTIFNAITRPQSGQSAQGLGTGYRPETVPQRLEHNGILITTRRQFNRIPIQDRRRHLLLLQDLKRRWGYFGAPPVPNDQVLHYYFNEPPRGRWPIIRVTYECMRTPRPIPFYNRA